MFDIKKYHHIYVYGAGAIGKKLANKLIAEGYIVDALIDQNADNIADSDVTVIDLSIFCKKMKSMMLNSVVVLITLNDAQNHDFVAGLFAEYGLSKILFLPMQDNFTQSTKAKYRFAYNEIVLHHNFEVMIPDYSEEILDCNNKYIIIDNAYKEFISLWFPVNELYRAIIDRGERYYDEKAIDFGEYQQLFNSIKDNSAKVENVKDYMLLQGRTTKESQNILFNNRKELYMHYERALMYDPNFFIYSPIHVELIKNRMRVIDGYHRLYFLYGKGYQYVPVVMKINDYKEYIKI